MNTPFFVPTRQDILDVEIGSKAPNCFGKMSKVTEVYAKEQDIYGKWFVCYYTKFGEFGSISNSLKEDQLHRDTSLSNEYKSHELDEIENEILEQRAAVA